MKKITSILRLMARHHMMIERFLKEFEKNIGKNFALMQDSLDRFKWEEEKHIFNEEKVAFKLYGKEDPEILKVVMRLIEEHDAILEMLNTIENDLAIKDRVDISDLVNLLDRHRALEEKILYPKLDEFLSKTQKKLIIERIREIPPGK